jgi:hypothetical protein
MLSGENARGCEHHDQQGQSRDGLLPDDLPTGRPLVTQVTQESYPHVSCAQRGGGSIAPEAT